MGSRVRRKALVIQAVKAYVSGRLLETPQIALGWKLEDRMESRPLAPHQAPGVRLLDSWEQLGVEGWGQEFP